MKKRYFYCLAILSMFIFPLAIKAKEITADFKLTENITDGILVKTGSNVTVDLAGFNVTNKAGYDTIKVEKGATLTIKGTGNVSNNSDSKAPIYNEGVLTIENGTYSRVDTASNTFYVVLNHGEMTINGGNFTVENGRASLIDNGWYEPSENTSKTMAILTINGGNFSIKNNDKFIKNDDFGILTVNGGTFKFDSTSRSVIANVGQAAGKETVTVTGGNFDYAGNYYAIVGKDYNKTIIKGGTFNLSDENAKVTNVSLEDETKEYKVLGETDSYIVVKTADLVKKVESALVKEDSVDAKELSSIKDAVSNKYTVASYYNIELFSATKDDIKVEKLTETDSAIKVTINIPSDIASISKGYKREYHIIRVHDGKAEVIDAVDNGNGTVSFKTDKFSTYALAYNDTKVETVSNTTEVPNTFDGIVGYGILGLISLLGLVGAGIYLKRKMN